MNATLCAAARAVLFSSVVILELLTFCPSESGIVGMRNGHFSHYAILAFFGVHPLLEDGVFGPDLTTR